jgi:transcriptional regulator with PAS, ATPase and Fis domain
MAPLGIRWIYPVGAPRATVLKPGTTTIGRDPSNDLQLDSPGISRQHAELERRGHALVIRDLGSRNGVYCNGVHVDAAPIGPATVMRLGDSVGVICAMDPARSGIWEIATNLWGSLRLESAARLALRAARSPLNILILGETGTGKELFAKAMHTWSGRPGELVPVNCAAIADSLMEAELFGHERGAFTGAARARLGHVREASRGLLFLDEIADLSLRAQAALLRVLQEREVTPVGSSERVPVDLRVVSATHKDLRKLMKAGLFREDLYARLEGVPMTLPPLRARREDIVDLFVYFAERIADAPCPPFTARFAERLACHDWPQNVRELRHLAERLIVVHGTAAQWRCRHLASAHPDLKSDSVPPTEHSPSTPARTPPGQIDRCMVEHALVAAAGNVAAAARSLRISKTTLYKLIEAHGLDLGTLRRSASG